MPRVLRSDSLSDGSLRFHIGQYHSENCMKDDSTEYGKRYMAIQRAKRGVDHRAKAMENHMWQTIEQTLWQTICDKP